MPRHGPGEGHDAISFGESRDDGIPLGRGGAQREQDQRRSRTLNAGNRCRRPRPPSTERDTLGRSLRRSPRRTVKSSMGWVMPPGRLVQPRCRRSCSGRRNRPRRLFAADGRPARLRSMVSVAPPWSALNTSSRSPKGASAWESKPSGHTKVMRSNGLGKTHGHPAPVAEISGGEVGSLDAQLPQDPHDPLVNGSIHLCRHAVLPAGSAALHGCYRSLSPISVACHCKDAAGARGNLGEVSISFRQ